MDVALRTLELPPPGPAPALVTARAACHRLAPGAPLPDGCEVVVPLPDATRFAYVPQPPTASRAAEVAPDPFLRGNAFKPMVASDRVLAAVFSLASGRRVEMGPESERVVLFLRGTGLVFAENGDTHRFEPLWAAVLPAGEPARVWAQGSDDAMGVVIQPQGERVERRTLAGEIARRRADAP